MPAPVASVGRNQVACRGAERARRSTYLLLNVPANSAGGGVGGSMVGELDRNCRETFERRLFVALAIAFDAGGGASDGGLACCDAFSAWPLMAASLLATRGWHGT